MTRKSERRFETAQRKVGDESEDIEELEADMAEEVAEIAAEWSEKAADIETVEIGLEKSDVRIDSVAVVWIPID